jgi:hypothetical protein
LDERIWAPAVYSIRVRNAQEFQIQSPGEEHKLHGDNLYRTTAAGGTPLEHTILFGGYPRAKVPLALGGVESGMVVFAPLPQRKNSFSSQLKQDRPTQAFFGNANAVLGGASPGFVRRIPAPVTCPTISTSPEASRLTLQGERGWGRSQNSRSWNSHQQQQ